MAVISLNNAKEQRQYSRNEIACLAAGVDPMQKQNETPYEKKREVVDWLCIIDKLISTGDIRPLVKRQTVINRNALLRQKSVIYSKRQEPEPVTKEVRIETFTHKDVVEAFEKHDIIDNYFNPENPKTETTNTPINSTPEPEPITQPEPEMEPIALPADVSKSVCKQNELDNPAWKKANETRIKKANEKKSIAITRLHTYDTKAQKKATLKGKPLSKNELLNMVKSELIKYGYSNPTVKTAPFREWYKLLSDDVADHWNRAGKSIQTP